MILDTHERAKNSVGRIYTQHLMRCDNDNCGKEFIRKPSLVKKVRTHHCSQKCYAENVSAKTRQICPNCSTEFKVTPTDIERGKRYCRQQCYYDHVIGFCIEEGCDEPITAKMRDSRNSPNKKEKQWPNHCTYHQRVLQGQKERRLRVESLGGKCACCGERDHKYLQIDHVNNDGRKHREAIRIGRKSKKKQPVPSEPYYYGATLSNTDIERYLNNNPGGLQILCANCNAAKNSNGGELYRPDKFTRRKAA